MRRRSLSKEVLLKRYSSRLRSWLLWRMPCQPLLKLGITYNFHHCPHTVVPKPTQSRADNFKIPLAVGCKYNRNYHPWHRILLEAQFGDKEAVNHILRPQCEPHIAIGGNDQRGGYEVISGSWVSHIQSDRRHRTCGGILQLGARAAKDAIRAGIAKIPGKLHTGNFDIHRQLRISIGVPGVALRPTARACPGKSKEEQGSKDSPKQFGLRAVG